MVSVEIKLVVGDVASFSSFKVVEWPTMIRQPFWNGYDRASLFQRHLEIERKLKRLQAENTFEMYTRQSQIN